MMDDIACRGKDPCIAENKDVWGKYPMCFIYTKIHVCTPFYQGSEKMIWHILNNNSLIFLVFLWSVISLACLLYYLATSASRQEHCAVKDAFIWYCQRYLQILSNRSMFVSINTRFRFFCPLYKERRLPWKVSCFGNVLMDPPPSCRLHTFWK